MKVTKTFPGEIRRYSEFDGISRRDPPLSMRGNYLIPMNTWREHQGEDDILGQVRTPLYRFANAFISFLGVQPHDEQGKSGLLEGSPVAEAPSLLICYETSNILGALREVKALP